MVKVPKHHHVVKSPGYELDGDPKFLTSHFTLPAITVRGRRGVAAGGWGGGGIVRLECVLAIIM